MNLRLFTSLAGTALAAGSLLFPSAAPAGTLDASFARVPQDSVVDLTAEGNLDWVHWGLYTETSLERKASVVPRIGNFELTWNQNNSNAWAFVYQFWDHYNGFSWSDGTPTPSVDHTTTGVWAYGIPNLGSGFTLQIPADTTLRTLKVYVGVYAGRGLFTASLSDGSALAYQNSSLSNVGNGEGAVYTIQFAADEPGQTLDLTWTLMLLMSPEANVTLQAAALSLPGGNNPPTVSLTAPAHNAQVSQGQVVQLEASAMDSDGSVSRVEFFKDDTLLGTDDEAPFVLEWAATELGLHSFQAAATDDGDATSLSVPVEVFVSSGLGQLAGSLNRDPPATLDLTLDGVTDWTHWGLDPSNHLNRKADVTAWIGDYTSMGTQPISTYTNHPTSFSWTDGTPEAVVTGTPNGIYATGVDGGFEVVLSADTTLRRARVYAGLYGAAGEFRAFLSDASAPAYVDTSLTNIYGDEAALFTLDYRAASPGQTLVIQHRPHRLYDLIYGNVTLQAVTLGLEGEEPPPPVVLYDPLADMDTFSFRFETRAGRLYVVDYRDSMRAGSPWQTWTNVDGTGQSVTVTHPRNGAMQRFYRVETR